MSKNLEGMFKKIPFEEACRKAKEYARKLEKLEAQGASGYGKKEIDKKYRKLINESVKYQMQFTEDEILVLLGIAIEDEMLRGDKRKNKWLYALLDKPIKDYLKKKRKK